MKIFVILAQIASIYAALCALRRERQGARASRMLLMLVALVPVIGPIAYHLIAELPSPQHSSLRIHPGSRVQSLWSRDPLLTEYHPNREGRCESTFDHMPLAGRVIIVGLGVVSKALMVAAVIVSHVYLIQSAFAS